MIKLKSLLPLVIAAAGVTGIPAAHAADGTIKFVGEIKGNICKISGGGAAGPNFTVTMDPVSITALTKAGEVAGSKPFSIELYDCNPDSGTVQTLFESASNIDINTNNLKLDGGGAENVQIRLLNAADNSRIMLGLGSEAQNSQSVKLSGGKASLKYYTQYYATGAAKPGKVSTAVTYSIFYR